MTILVFGKTGQVARALDGREGVNCLSRAVADLQNPGGCAEIIETSRPAAVINAAAYTAVDRAEEEEPLARTINAEAPEAMARACAKLGIPFVTISTDYVFDGSGETPWAPNDKTAPLGAYGRSKLAGENAIAAAGGAWAILRTSWVFAPIGHNFVTTMLRLGAERDSLRIVSDQIGGPTPAEAIADTCLAMAYTMRETPESCGIYHLSGTPDVSWAEFAREIFAQANLTCSIEEISSDDYPTAAQRPLNSRLDCSSLQPVFGVTQPDWRAYLPAVIQAQAKDGL